MRKKPLVTVSAERIEQAILVVHGQKAMLDANLATIYGVTTKRLNEHFRRNRQRFPEDFAFQLSAKEFQFLRSQFATSSSTWGGRRYPLYVFTEHGAVWRVTSRRTSDLHTLLSKRFRQGS